MAHKGVPQNHAPLRPDSMARSLLEASIAAGESGLLWSEWARDRKLNYGSVGAAVFRLRLKHFLKPPRGGADYGKIWATKTGVKAASK